MIGDRSLARHRSELALADEVGEKLHVMHDLVGASEIRILVAQRVETVRARGDDLLDARAVKGRDVLAGQSLKRVLVAHPASRVSGACLARPEHGKIHAGHLQQLRRRDRSFSCALVERGRAADPEQHVGSRLTRLQHSNPQPLRPLHPIGLRLAPGIRRSVDVAQHRARLFGESRLDHHEVAPEVDDVVDVLDVHRALAHARTACDAVPHDVIGHSVGHDRH